MRDIDQYKLVPEKGDLSFKKLKEVYDTSFQDSLSQQAKRKEIAIRLKEIRKQFGLTQKDLCDKIGVVITTYASYEQGKQFIPISTIAKICNLLDISADYVICISDNPKGRYYTEPKEAEKPTESETESIEERLRRLEEKLLSEEY